VTPQEIDGLVALATGWVEQQRAEHRPQGWPLTPMAQEPLTPYYATPDLAAVRWRVVPEIENPAFQAVVAAQLAAEGFPAMDFREMAGITFVDTILLSSSRRPADAQIASLLVHEMVHVVQYRLLGGLGPFMHEYVWGMARNGFDYFKIPLEVQAYAIEARAATGETFLVEPALREMLGLGPALE
jgi:hypothetical protein